MRITVYSVGKADAVLFESAAGCAMIDTGLGRRADELLSSLKEKGITSLKALIITHFDKDHAGGAAKLIRSLHVESVYTTYPSVNGDCPKQLPPAMKKKGIIPKVVTDHQIIRIGSMEFMIDGASGNYRKAHDNNSSLITMLTYGTQKFLFMGDADEERILEYCAEYDAQTDFLKMPGHGRYHQLTELMIVETAPSYAVITNGNKVPLRSELKKTEQLLEMYGTEYYETRNGNVVLDCTLNDFIIRQERKEKR